MFGLGKTLTLIIKVFLVGLSQFCSFVLKWFGFGWKVSGEKGQKDPIFVLARLLYASAKVDSPR